MADCDHALKAFHSITTIHWVNITGIHCAFQPGMVQWYGLASLSGKECQWLQSHADIIISSYFTTIIV